MTSASELFYNRRSRLGRNSIELEGFDSSANRFSRYHRHYHNRHRNHHDVDGCDPLHPRSSNPTRPIQNLSHAERESVRVDQGSSQSTSANVINLENFRSVRNGQRLTGNDRLPGPVLLARERLLERLRGVSPSGNRQRYWTSSGIHDDDFTSGSSIRNVDPEDWETDARDLPAGVMPVTDSNPQPYQLLLLQETRTRPPGLTQETLDHLHIEIFRNEERGDERETSRTSQECSICLDSFLEGDQLICLPCRHRFHSCCLDPWVRTCGDCPYCRTDIVVTSLEP